MKKILLKDIANHVGVSTALVSYVLNGQAAQKQVSKENAARILAAARELNYRPNQIAKSLKIQKTNTIGLVVADINYRFSSGITSAIEAQAKKRNFNVIFGSSNESDEKFEELVTVLLNRQVDGLILVPTENAEHVILQLQQAGVHFVLVDRNFPQVLTNSILLDNYQAAYQSAQYLIKQGHKKIAFITYQNNMFHLKERERGYKAALVDNGLTINQALIKPIQAGNVAHDVSAAIDALMQGQPMCDAIFFATDRLAIAGLQQINKRKIKVPHDVSVFSFDEAEAFSLFNCPISHARQPLQKMGELAVDALLNLVNSNTQLNQVYLQSDFVYGQSCRE